MFPLNPKSHVRARKTAEIVAGRIRRAIVQGSIGPGESLPSEAELIQMFEVSRPTIREAIRILEFENLISVLRG
ncbi:MAG TPA: GntR family transcriptional regulator, partial [Caulobacteraceae bacterium]|nr:GntR family transcriptional regulator [Caulobacteraceae bacterium]